jgi:hypothetical protein
MLATYPNAKRKFRADDTFSTLDLEPFYFSIGVFPSPIHAHKRARLSQPRPLVKEWSWSLATTTADDEHRLSTTAALSFSCTPGTSFPDNPIPVDAYEDNERPGRFLSTVSGADKDMPTMKRPRLVKSSDAGKGPLSETLESGDPHPPPNQPFEAQQASSFAISRGEPPSLESLLA